MARDETRRKYVSQADNKMNQIPMWWRVRRLNDGVALLVSSLPLSLSLYSKKKKNIYINLNVSFVFPFGIKRRPWRPWRPRSVRCRSQWSREIDGWATVCK